MGQQQLLLLVLATVIVGLATVAGIQAFDKSQKQIDRDARRQVAADILSDFKGLVNKPSELGGVEWYEGGPTYWDKAKNEREALNQMGYDAKVEGGDGSKVKDGEAVVPIEGSGGWCEFDVEGATARIACYPPSGNRNQRVLGLLNRYDNGEIIFWN